MSNITNPQAIKFTNEQVRPLCESIRALKARVDSMTTEWYGGVNAIFPNDNSAVADDRDNEGVSRLTGADINNAVGNLIAASAALNAEIIEKPCVQVLFAS